VYDDVVSARRWGASAPVGAEAAGVPR
jgi:hypothetical protein